MQNLNFTTTEGIKFEMKFRKPDSRTHAGCDGVCYYPDWSKGEINGKIHINPYRRDQCIFNTIIHETTHAYFWDKTEKEVTAFANTLSRILYNELKFRGSITPALSNNVKYKRNKGK
jgi:hypothetical protein